MKINHLKITLKGTLETHRPGERCLFEVAGALVAMDTEGLRLGTLPLLFQMGHECHSPPCCPPYKG